MKTDSSNLKFEYLHRDGGNYKIFGSIIINNIDKIYSKDQENIKKININPSEIVTMLTLEEITIPHNCSGTVFAKNSFSSNGFLILNPGHIDPGFQGRLTICAINLSTKTETIWIGRNIFTLIISELDSEVPKEYHFKNKKIVDRKTEELLFHNQKFKFFSNSIFDLILNNDSNKLSEKVLIQIQNRQSKTILEYKWAIISVLVAIFLSIIAYGTDVFGVYDKEPESNLDYIFQETRQLNEKFDSLLKKVENIQQINDSQKATSLNIDNDTVSDPKTR